LLLRDESGGFERVELMLSLTLEVMARWRLNFVVIDDDDLDWFLIASSS